MSYVYISGSRRERLERRSPAVLAHVRVLDDAQAFRDRGHHPVLDAVVHHLHEVPGAVRTAMQVTVGCGAVGSRATGVGSALPFPG